jgi:hypothetical protein
MKTVHNNAELLWHLQHREPPLTAKAIENVLRIADRLNRGKITLETVLADAEQEPITVGELFTELKIETTNV